MKSWSIFQLTNTQIDCDTNMWNETNKSFRSKKQNNIYLAKLKCMIKNKVLEKWKFEMGFFVILIGLKIGYSTQ